MSDPIEVLLQFAFLGVLYLFLLWVARSALQDLGRPGGGSVRAARRQAERARPYRRGWWSSAAAGLRRAEWRRIRPAIGRAEANEIRIEDSLRVRAPRARSTTARAWSTSRT